MNSQYFSSLITTSSNPHETWVLLIEQTYGSSAENNNEAFLRNAERIINIIPVCSNKNGNDSRMLPALAYEFIEKGQSLCSMQYYGGGAMGYNKNIVWFKPGLEPGIKLILSAAMTSLMQLKAP